MCTHPVAHTHTHIMLANILCFSFMEPCMLELCDKMHSTGYSISRQKQAKMRKQRRKMSACIDGRHTLSRWLARLLNKLLHAIEIVIRQKRKSS